MKLRRTPLLAWLFLFHVALLAPSRGAVLIDTGPGSASTSGGSALFNSTSVDGQFNFLAGQFTIDNTVAIDTVEGWMSISAAGSVDVFFYPDVGGFPDTSSPFFFGTFSSSNTASAHFEVFSGGFQQLDPGTYWVSFEPLNGSFQAIMPTGAPQPLSRYAFFSDVTNAWTDLQKQLGIRISGVAKPVIISPLTMTATVGQPFVYQFEVQNEAFLDVQSLPPGLRFDTDLNAIVGTPTQSGTFTVDLGASNAAGSDDESLVNPIRGTPSGPSIISSTSATGKTGDPFKFQVVTDGTSSAVRLSATGLPPGLSVDTLTGVISGTPTSDGSFLVNLTAVDGSQTATGSLQLTFISDPVRPVIVSSKEAGLVPGQPFSYSIEADTTAGPSDPTVFTLIGTLPPGLIFNSSTGVISGTPLANIEVARGKALSGGVITNVQIFATNSQGTGTTPLLFFLTPTGAVNISTRLAIGTGENVLIGGFIITGNAPKKVILRAIGPSLKVNNVPVAGRIADPILELRKGQTLLGSNDDWRSAQEQEIIDTTVPPTDNRESALVAVLQPGAYTATVRGKANGTGIGLVEVFDLGTASLDSESKAQLVNISTRGLVQNTNNVMIGGFIVSGPPTEVLVRAIGPELTAQGVNGALQDTTLDLVDANGQTLATNDNWQSSQKQQIIDTTVPPTDDRESAIVRTLNPGAYTSIVRGKNGTTGVALVEVYVLQ